MDEWRRRLDNAGKPTTHYDVTELVGKAFPLACTPTNVMHGFKVSGIYPLNENIFQDHEFLASNVTDRPIPPVEFKMETCDISLVKQEIVEIIKTEPQNEDEFDTCGQSGIKTEDESDTSNSVDEIVKTEIKLFDSSFGIMDTNIDHFTPVDKSEWSPAVAKVLESCLLGYDFLFLGLGVRWIHFHAPSGAAPGASVILWLVDNLDGYPSGVRP
uniref:Uncharacterized protein n=1 Tax=Timema douglasi TaxID=61478 RepID=A0A7R8VWE3_TIMDO|nr:unnamed protein product [Timema douglasi]